MQRWCTSIIKCTESAKDAHCAPLQLAAVASLPLHLAATGCRCGLASLTMAAGTPGGARMLLLLPAQLRPSCPELKGKKGSPRMMIFCVHSPVTGSTPNWMPHAPGTPHSAAPMSCTGTRSGREPEMSYRHGAAGMMLCHSCIRLCLQASAHHCWKPGHPGTAWQLTPHSPLQCGPATRCSHRHRLLRRQPVPQFWHCRQRPRGRGIRQRQRRHIDVLRQLCLQAVARLRACRAGDVA